MLCSAISEFLEKKKDRINIVKILVVTLLINEINKSKYIVNLLNSNKVFD